MADRAAVAFLGNGAVGVRVLRALFDVQGPPSIVVLEHQGPGVHEMRELASASGCTILDASAVADGRLASEARAQGCEVGLSAYFGRLLPVEAIDAFRRGVVNVHGSMLPLHRGTNPNVWCIVEKTTAGATMHLMEKGVDCGPIIAQRRISIRPDMTGRDVYDRLSDAVEQLVRDHWVDYAEGRIGAVRQAGDGCIHRRADLEGLKELDLTAPTTLGAALDLLRALQFPPHPGPRFTVDGREYEVRMEITEVAPQGTRPSEAPEDSAMVKLA